MSIRHWTQVGLFIAFWLLYQATIGATYSYDGLCYALDVEFAGPANWFHANHLLYTFLSHGFYRLMQALGYHSRAIYLMQSMNAFLGAAVVSLFFALLRERIGQARALGGAILFGISSALWIETTDPGCYALVALGTCLLLELLLRAVQMRAFAVGLFHGLLVLCHQMLVLVAPAFAYRLRAPKSMAFYVMGLSVGAGVPYAMVATWLHGGSLHEGLYWALGPGGPRPGTPIFSRAWWSLDMGDNLVKAWTGFVQSLAAGVPGAPLVLVVGILLLTVWSYRHLDPETSDGRDLISIWIWVVVLNAFLFFFWPGTPHYRITFLPPLIFLALKASRTITPGVWLPIKRSGVTGGLAWQLVIAAGLLLVAWLNFQITIRPRLGKGSDAIRTSWIKSQAGPFDFLVFEGRGKNSITNIYVAYFAPEVRARSLQGFFFLQNDGGVDPLASQLLAARRAGGRILMEKSLLDPSVQTRIESEAGVPAGVLTRWMNFWKAGRVHSGPDGYDLVEVSPA